MTTPVLHLLAGPNGSGRSSFVADVLAPLVHLEIVNADEIAHLRWPGDELVHAHEAAAIAAARREELITARASFVSETVFSHPGEIDLVQHALSCGYYLRLHVMLIPLETTVQRVAYRVAKGGHDVPEVKIRSRYDRLWRLVAKAIEVVDAATVYDNSLAAKPFRRVARFERGTVIGTPQWPSWTPDPLRALADDEAGS